MKEYPVADNSFSSVQPLKAIKLMFYNREKVNNSNNSRISWSDISAERKRNNQVNELAIKWLSDSPNEFH